MWPFNKKDIPKDDPYKWNGFGRAQVCNECETPARLYYKNMGNTRIPNGVCQVCGSQDIRDTVGRYKVKIDHLSRSAISFAFAKDFQERGRTPINIFDNATKHKEKVN